MKIIFINIYFILTIGTIHAQSTFVLKKVKCNKNTVEITICNSNSNNVFIPKFSLRIIAKEKCNLDYWKIQFDTLYVTFTSQAPSCLQGNIIPKSIFYRDINLKPGDCCKQILVLEKEVKFRYLIFTYDDYLICYKK